jgi:hypothetical protein
MSADDEAVDPWRVRERPHEHIDALPGIEVAGIAGNETPGVRRRQGTRIPRAIGHDEHSRAVAKPAGEFRSERGCDRDVGRRMFPDALVAPLEPPELRRRRRQLRLAEQPRHFFRDRRGNAVRLIHDVGPARLR